MFLLCKEGTEETSNQNDKVDPVPLRTGAKNCRMQEPKRKIVRLPDFGYGAGAWYFITVCTKDRARLLGQIVGAADQPPVQTCLSAIGQIAARNLLAIPAHLPGARVEQYVIMPDHVHLILSITDAERQTGGVYAAPTVPRVMNAWKGSVSRAAGRSVWQRSYHEHVIRGPQDLAEIRQYIENNPLQWVLDGKA